MSDLAEVLVPIGVAGAVLAVLCAVAAGAAVVRGTAGFSGGAVAVWFPFALLSMAASFAGQWIPLFVSIGALAVALTIGGIVRAVLNSFATGRRLQGAVGHGVEVVNERSTVSGRVTGRPAPAGS